MIVHRISEFIARVIVGLVFAFSGFVKAVDPLGSAYKFADYFEAFNLEALIPIALPLSFILSAFEFAIGVALVLNLLKRFNSWLLISFMVYFTGLTLMIAVTNPVADCGCFGDALIISNWATFYKNVVLLALSILILINNHRFFNHFYSLKVQRVLWSFFFVFSLLLSAYSMIFLPILDFRPYKVGENIYQSMIIPEGAESDVYKTTLYYQKDNVIKEFTEDNYPWEDTTWHFVTTETELLKKGYEPPVKNFNVLNSYGEDIGMDIIVNTEFQVIIFIDNISRITDKLMSKIQELHDLGLLNELNVFIISSASHADNIGFLNKLDIDIPVYEADDILIKTIIRANPGVVILKEGTIIGKYNLRTSKVDDKFVRPLDYTLKQQKVVQNRYNILTLSLIFLIILLVYQNVEKKY